MIVTGRTLQGGAVPLPEPKRLSGAVAEPRDETLAPGGDKLYQAFHCGSSTLN
jgi:hypothetical protein